RIEGGYGLEPVINDARAGDAGRAMVSVLRRGDFSSAIETAAWQLAKYIADDRGVTLSGQPPVRQLQRRDVRSRGGIPFWLIIGIFLLIWFMSRSSGGGRGGGGWWILPLLSGWGGGGRGGWGGGGFGGSGWGGGGSGGGGFGGFGGGSSGGGGASGRWWGANWRHGREGGKEAAVAGW